MYENKWITVNEHQVVNPSGKDGIYGVVHFKNTAVGIVPYDGDGMVWLVGQFRYPLNQYSWEIPEGGCPEGEDLQVAAKRELLEETGIIAESLEPLVQLHLSNSVSDEYAIVYLATGLSFTHADPEETEELSVRKVALHEAMQMINDGVITDSMTVAGLQQLFIQVSIANFSRP